MTEAEVGGCMGRHCWVPCRTGSDLGGVFSKQADQRQPRGDRRCGREGSSRPHRRHQRSFPLECVWDSRESAHFLPPALPVGTHPLTGNCMGSSAGKLHPSCVLRQQFSHKAAEVTSPERERCAGFNFWLRVRWENQYNSHRCMQNKLA